MSKESNKKVGTENLSVDELTKKIINSDLWVTINESDKGVEVRANKPEAISLIGEWLYNDRPLFESICKYIKAIDEESKAKMN